MDAQEQINLLKMRAEKFIGEDELLERIKAGKRLRVKLGVDPTRPDLTFGHMVVFNKLRQFQDLGHQAVLIIGDFTTRVGDPTGRSAARPVLSPEEIDANAKTYLDQAFKILDPEKTEVRHNSEWFEKMSMMDVLKLCRQMTVARMLERDDFAKRYASKTPISIVEFLYPLLQGYDSIMVESDIELGGTDQLFNNLVGRQLLEEAGKAPQAVMTLPLLVGLDGERKMSKSYGNYIALNDSAKDMFGKVMSIPDKTMWVYYELLLEKSPSEILAMKQQHPMEMKKQLASALTAKFYGEAAGKYEREQFEAVFSKKQVRADIPEFAWEKLVPAGTADATLVDLLAGTGFFASKKEIRRLIEQGAVKLNDTKVEDAFLRLTQEEADGAVVQAGKRIFVKILK
ncbi:MAG: tyrosine--tRNA ligase [Opitutales bacterium]|nr:tyrosine--tRNA ligase [Opitutales bacterium]